MTEWRRSCWFFVASLVIATRIEASTHSAGWADPRRRISREFFPMPQRSYATRLFPFDAYGSVASFVVVLAMFAFAMPSPALVAANPPNVVVILTDDQGWGDLSLHGNTNLETPHLDALARAGARFERFFVSPVCSPTRAEFLTGRYHARGGVFSTSAGGERLDLDETTIAEVFGGAGYATAAFGKWHNGMQYPYHPNGRGFGEYYGFCSGHWGDYFDPPLDHNGNIVRGNGYLTDDFTTRAIRFIEDEKQRPFFVYLPLCTPHSPMQVPDRWWKRFASKTLERRGRNPAKEDVPHTRAALAMCENIDWNVGRLLAKLDELDLADDTIVAFFCDNGPNGNRWNGDMKGRKGSTDEGGVRSPLFVRWPGAIEAGLEVKTIAAAIDLFPTLADLAGVDVPARLELDGRSLRGWLVGEPPDDWPDREIISHWGGRVSVRTQRFRLGHRGALFDMVEDPGQRSDVSADHAEVAARLRASADRFKTEVLAGYRGAKRPFVLGHPDAKFTQLPARDAKFTGNVRRSNRFPNCSYLLGWTSPGDRITWDVVVPESGRFAVSLYYAVSKKDVGATVELSFGDSRVRKRIDAVNDPPMRGAENDRVERRESYVRDFRPLALGTIDLAAGEGTLTLRAIEVPGTEASQVRTLLFERIAPTPGDRR